MKLSEIINKQKLIEESKKGTYVGVHFDSDTVKRIKEFAVDNKISLQQHKLHTTVLYSLKYLPNCKSLGKLNTPLIGRPKKFSVVETSFPGDQDQPPNESGKIEYSLVLQYDSPELVARNKELKKEHSATHHFDPYKPHITLSYDVGDINVSKLNSKDIGNINIVLEYGKDLDFN